MLGQDEIGFFWFFLSINRTEPKLIGFDLKKIGLVIF
jgi:hypothetical protein